MLDNEKHLRKLLNHIARVTGFNARDYRPTTLRRRLEWRLIATGSKSYGDYLAHLKTHPSECFKFLDALFINVTEFFRDKRIFQCLKKKILPALLDKTVARKQKRLSIWSIACSKGQEPYSLAMTLDDLLEKRKDNIQISVTATDVSRTVIKQAQLAHYKKSEMKNVPREYQQKYFKKMKNGDYKIVDSLKRSVRFKCHDLIQEDGLGKFHLISCRNLLIFFNTKQQNRMFKKIHSALNKHGILVLGSAETPKEEGLFHCISSRNHIYQKTA
ncbi:MAG: protein-glutamate O-methyltransferase CheR [Candidatus Aminicenantales bacterium]